jgi:hypothetical protein
MGNRNRKGRPPTPGTACLRIGRTSGSMTAAPIPICWVFSASGFAAGPMRKPGAARLMNWFYETSSLSLIPPVWRIAYPVLIVGPATTICACLGCTVKAQFWGRKRQVRACTPPPPRSGIQHHRSRGIPATGFDSHQSCNQIFAPHLPESARTLRASASNHPPSSRRPADLSIPSPRSKGLQTASRGCRYHPGPCRIDLHVAPGRNGRSVVRMSRHWRMRRNANMY